MDASELETGFRNETLDRVSLGIDTTACAPKTVGEGGRTVRLSKPAIATLSRVKLFAGIGWAGGVVVLVKQAREESMV